MNPLLSIIIPVYKVKDFVGQCLQSVFDGGADESRYEVIVVNDGTPDGSMDIVRKVCAGHDNVTIIEQENQGLSAARMAGEEKAEGEYVWFVDSDDWLEKGAVDAMLVRIDKNPEIDVFTMPLLWTGTGEVHLDYEIGEDAEWDGKALLQTKYPLWAAPRHITRRTLFLNDEVHFPIGLLHEDEYFYRVLLYRAPRVLLMKGSMYYYRQRDNSIMSGKSTKSLYDIVSVYRLLEAFMCSKMEPADRKWFRQDITALLLKTYRESFGVGLYDSTGAKEFRRKNRFFVFTRGMRCSAFSLKEKAWIVCLLFIPKALKNL